MGFGDIFKSVASVAAPIVGGIFGGPGGAAAGAAIGGMLNSNEERIGAGDYYPDWLRGDWQNTASQITGLPQQNVYGGQMVADQNPWLMRGTRGAYNFGIPGGAGHSMAVTMGNAGRRALKTGNRGSNWLENMMGQGAPQFQYDQGTFDQVMGNLMPGLQGSYDAMMRDPLRQFTEQTIPGINMGASGAGQAFGTRGANQTAIAARGLQDRAADTAAGLWANAANQANQAGYGAGGQNLNATMGNNDMIARTALGYGNLGQSQLNQGYNMQKTNLDMANNAGMQRRGWEQERLDANMARFNAQQAQPWNDLSNRLSLINSQRMINAPTTIGMSPFDGLMQGGMFGLGMYGAGKDAGWWGGSGGGVPGVPPPAQQGSDNPYGYYPIRWPGK